MLDQENNVIFTKCSFSFYPHTRPVSSLQRLRTVSLYTKPNPSQCSSVMDFRLKLHVQSPCTLLLLPATDCGFRPRCDTDKCRDRGYRQSNRVQKVTAGRSVEKERRWQAGSGEVLLRCHMQRCHAVYSVSASHT